MDEVFTVDVGIFFLLSFSPLPSFSSPPFLIFLLPLHLSSLSLRFNSQSLAERKKASEAQDQQLHFISADKHQGEKETSMIYGNFLFYFENNKLL